MADLRELLAPHRPLVEENLASLYDQKEALLREIEQHEMFLVLLGKESAGQQQPDETNNNGKDNGGGNAHVRLSAKRKAIQQLMSERPGVWTPRAVRKALAERGIDPQAGTPVKNILWHLAKAGEIEAVETGVYKFPATGDTGAIDHQQEVVGL